MLLSGLILSCLLQLAHAQQRVLSVAVEPRNPKWGKNVMLSLRGHPRHFEHCQWERESQAGGPSGTILTYSPRRQPQPTSLGAASSGRERVSQDCSLEISWLRNSDAGNYSVTINVGSTQQQEDSQKPAEIYQGSFYLEISELNQIAIRVEPRPKYPSEGQNVTLVPLGLPNDLFFCEWLRQTRFGTEELIQTYIHGEQQRPQRRRETVYANCSLALAQLTASDTGNYTIMAEGPLSQQQQPGKRPEQGELEGSSQVYLGHLQLAVSRSSKTDSHSGHDSGSAHLNYSAWVVAGALLGSLAWAEPLMALLSVFRFFCR